MKIAIRVEGGELIGMGHVMRTLVLAGELSLNNEVCYICKYSLENENGIVKIESRGFKVYTFKKEISEVLSGIDVDLLITDSYDVDENYFEQAKKYVEYTAYIDDIASFECPVDLIVNQNINALDLNYSQEYKLLGLKYLMIRDEFKNLPPKPIEKQVKDIMVTVGGSDPAEFTKVLIRWMVDLNFTFHVIVGPSFKNKEYFKNIHYDNIRFYFNPRMSDIMKVCDLAVSASGSSMYELLACGVPVLGVVIADNQLDISKKLENMDLVENLGWYGDLDEGSFKSRLIDLCHNCSLRKERSVRGQKLIDGLGARRIADFIEHNFKV